MLFLSQIEALFAPSRGFNPDQAIEMGDNILALYNQPHRYYHNLDHIFYIFKLINKEKLGIEDLFKLKVAALFHDVIYDPRSKTNEEDSAEYFKKIANSNKSWLSESDIEEISSMIMATKTHDVFNSHLEKLLCKFDLMGFEESFGIVMMNGDNIFKEYQFVEFSDFKQGRKQILEKYKANSLISEKGKLNIQMEIEYYDHHYPNIAIYPGSFYPFHKGHLNILKKAEKIFDKVIIAVGKNPDK